MSIRRSSLLIFCLFFALSLRTEAAPQIYISDSFAGNISRYQADGGGREELLTSFNSPSYLNFDATNSKVYWPAKAKIVRADLDGSNVETVYDSQDGLKVVFKVVVDPVNGFVYWADFSDDAIRRGTIDGTGAVVTLFDTTNGVNDPIGLAIDTSGGKIYWSQGAQIVRANIDGSGVVEILHGSGTPIDIALDIPNGKVYWTDNVGSVIESGNMDGSGGVDTLFNAGDGIASPAGLSLDLDANLIYFVQGNGQVRRANMNGTGTPSQLFDLTTVDGNGSVQGIAVASSSLIIAGDVDLIKANKDGTGTPATITSLGDAILEPFGFTLDLTGNKLYASDAPGFGEPAIESVDLDFAAFTKGSLTGTVEQLFTNTDDSIGFPESIAVDRDGGMLYWVSAGDEIQRGNIDGSGSPETIYNNADDGIQGVSELFIDADNDLLYWIDTTNTVVQRGPTDGSAVPTDLFSAADGIQSLNGMTVDLTNSFIYWGDPTKDTISRGNLDGSGSPVDLFGAGDGVSFPLDVGVDLQNQKLFWLEPTKVLRGNLDGSGTPEEIITKLVSSSDMILTPDADDDGVPDEIDSCSSDAMKTEPGDCGCGTADSDTNSNSISDCLLNEDIKEQLATIIDDIKSLKTTRTKKKKLNKSRREKQKPILEQIQLIAEEIKTLVDANESQYNLSKPNAKLKKLARLARVRSLRSRKTGNRKFRALKKRALKALRKLNNVLT